MNRQFTALSGMAMLLIVLNHAIQFGLDYPRQFGYAPLPEWAQMFLTVLQAFGVFAVPVFLFISGSFVAYAAQGNPPRLSKKFLGSSLRHIVTPYIIWSVIFYAEIYFHRGDQYTPLEYLKNLVVGYPYHFIPLLLFYYAFSPLLVRLSRQFAWLILVVVAVYQLFLLNFVYPEVLGFQFPDWAQALTPPVLRQTLADWALFFPLGLIYGLHARQWLPVLRKISGLLMALSAGLFVLGLLDAFEVIYIPIARHLCALPFVLALPAIKREIIPFVKTLEKVGRRSYGLYLSHLVVLDLSLLIMRLVIPAIFGIPLLLFLLLFITGLTIPLLLMEMVSRGPTRRLYRYVFG